MRRSKLFFVWWGFWIVGTGLVVASWFNVVTPTVGWCGFALGMVGYACARIPFLNPETLESPPADSDRPGDTTDSEPDGQHNWGKEHEGK